MGKEYRISSYKSYIVFAVFFSLISCSSLKENIKNDSKDRIMIKCLIKQVGIDWDAYYITLSEGCLYEVKKVVLLENQIISNDNVLFKEIIDNAKTNLTEADFQNFKNLILHDKQEKLNILSNIKKGGWEIYIILEDRKHHFYLKEINDSTAVNQIFYKIKNLSPIQINLQWR